MTPHVHTNKYHIGVCIIQYEIQGLPLALRLDANAEFKATLQLNLYCPSGSSWPALGWKLPFTCLWR